MMDVLFWVFAVSLLVSLIAILNFMDDPHWPKKIRSRD